MFILLQPISVKAFDFNKIRNDTIEARFYDPLRRALHHARPARSLLSSTAQIEVTMERAILLFVILFSLSPLANASTPNAETDSIILYKDVFFRGTRLFPKDINGDTVRAIESRVFKVLLSNDTLVAVTDNPAVFPDELKKLSRGQIRMRFMKKAILLRSMTTCQALCRFTPKKIRWNIFETSQCQDIHTQFGIVSLKVSN